MHHKLLFIMIFLGAAVSPSFAQESKKLFTVHQGISTPGFGYLPTLVARSKGMFAQEGIDLKLIVISARVALPALMAKEVHFGTAGSRLAASLRGSPLKALFFSYNT